MMSKHFARLLPMLACGLLGACASVAPAPRRPVLTFAQIADAHLRPEFEAPARFRAALGQLRKTHPEIAFVLNTGDAVDGIKNHADAVAKWGFWQAGIDGELKGIPVYSVLGNHDFEGPANDPLCGKAAVGKRLGMPSRYYSFDKAGWHFILLDGNGFAADKEQNAWLVKELATVPATTPIVMVSHEPFFSFGALVHSPGDFIGNWKGLVALFGQHPNVKLCLGGHTHEFDKTWHNGITYVCGGSLAGYWWEREKSHDGKGGYNGTRPGYGIIRLYADGTCDCDYVKSEN
jgi:predicted phosphodiesterase